MSELQTHKPHVLVVDDDKRICDLVFRFLRDNGFVVLTAQSVDDAEEKMSSFSFDALVVDVMMPGRTGTEFVQEMRARNDMQPVLLLTALGEAEDRILGFESGADDYLAKPFEPKELVLRLKAILRRVQAVQKPKQSAYMIGAWRFDPQHDELESEEGRVVRLTSVEGNLLRALIDSIGEVVTRDELAQRCDLDTGARTIDVQVTRLRKKLEENTKAPRYLQTIRGKGYLLRANVI